MRLLLILMLCVGISSCLSQSKDSSEAKKLHKGKGEFKRLSEARKQQKKRRDRAADDIKKLCGSVLKKRKWAQGESTAPDDGFFYAETKVKSCPQQRVHIGVKAAEFMRSKSITCSKTSDDYLRFELPQSPSYTAIIKADCDSQFVELRSDGASLTLVTIEANSRSNLVTVDATGKWDGSIQLIDKGLNGTEMSDLKTELQGIFADEQQLKRIQDQNKETTLVMGELSFFASFMATGIAAHTATTATAAAVTLLAAIPITVGLAAASFIILGAVTLPDMWRKKR